MNESTLLTAKDVANILKISEALAYRLISEGQLLGVRFGRTDRLIDLKIWENLSRRICLNQ